jgi:hypothetical protein
VELAAGIDQTTVSMIERGWAAHLTLTTVRRAFDAVGVRLELAPRMSAADVASLLDEGHARLVETVLGVLHRHGWKTVAEYTFNHFGDRGSVDILAWHPATRTLLIVEVKTIFVDVQDLLGTLDRKCRVVPSLVSRERGWHPLAVGRVVVVENRAAARRTVDAHEQTFGSVLPARSRRVGQWLATPDGPLAGLWFLSSTTGGRGKRASGGVLRLRRPRPQAR